MGEAEELLRAADRLADRLGGASPAWFAARARAAPGGAGGPAGDGLAGDELSRAQLLRALAHRLAELGASVVAGQPPAARPPVLGDHALADQLRVLARELASAPAGGDATAAGRRAVRAAADRL